MAYDVIVGRNESDRKRFGEEGTVLLGKQYVKMGPVTSLSNNVFLDVNRPHVILLAGKRGSGKSYTLSVIAEGISNLPKYISKNISVLIFDTMGVFWTMKYKNLMDEDLLMEWGMSPEELNILWWVPKGFYKKYERENLPVDKPFTIKPSELNSGDWCEVFGVSMFNEEGILIEKAVSAASKKGNYSILDVVKEIQKDKKSSQRVRDGLENRFLAAHGWGLFSKEGTAIKDLLVPGRTSVLDVSVYTHVAGSWAIKNLVIGLVSRKLLLERMINRKVEELANIKYGTTYFTREEEKETMPLVWLMLDEAHEALPKEGKTPATDALVQLLREGRQPGVTLVLATQQPGEIHRDVITQSDIVISHRLTAKRDIEALNAMMQSYLQSDMVGYLNNLPRLSGSGIVLDDNSERIYPIRVRPKLSWHGGAAPSALKIRKEIMF